MGCSVGDANSVTELHFQLQNVSSGFSGYRKKTDAARSVQFLCVQLVDSVESVKEAEQAAGHAHARTRARTVMLATKGCSQRLIKAVADGHAGTSKLRLGTHTRRHTHKDGL